jgi:hypothetical protein
MPSPARRAGRVDRTGSRPRRRSSARRAPEQGAARRQLRSHREEARRVADPDEEIRQGTAPSGEARVRRSDRRSRPAREGSRAAGESTSATGRARAKRRVSPREARVRPAARRSPRPGRERRPAPDRHRRPRLPADGGADWSGRRSATTGTTTDRPRPRPHGGWRFSTRSGRAAGAESAQPRVGGGPKGLVPASEIEYDASRSRTRLP